MYPPPDQWQYKDHLQRRLAQGHIWSLPLRTITAPFFVSPLRLNYFQVFVSYCWKNMKWIFKVGEGRKIFDETWKRQMDGNSELLNRERGGERERGEKKMMWCSILFLIGILGKELYAWQRTSLCCVHTIWQRKGTNYRALDHLKAADRLCHSI